MNATTDRPPDGDLAHGYREIGLALGLSARQVKHLHESKSRQPQPDRIPTFNLGKNVCARRSTLAAWLAEQERKSRAGVDHA